MNSKRHDTLTIDAVIDKDSLDNIDRRILAILTEDGRLPYATVADQVGLSRVAVTKRIESLVRKGIIKGFTIEVPSEFIRKSLPVYFDLKFSPVHLVAAAERIAEHQDIATVYQMSARNSLHVHGFFTNMEEVSTFIDDFLATLPGIQSVESDFLMRRYKSSLV